MTFDFFARTCDTSEAKSDAKRRAKRRAKIEMKIDGQTGWVRVD